MLQATDPLPSHTGSHSSACDTAEESSTARTLPGQRVPSELGRLDSESPNVGTLPFQVLETEKNPQPYPAESHRLLPEIVSEGDHIADGSAIFGHAQQPSIRLGELQAVPFGEQTPVARKTARATPDLRPHCFFFGHLAQTRNS